MSGSTVHSEVGGAWELVVLGIVQDGGMPHLGCTSDPCEMARRGERPRERVSCLGITDGERAYLFDATPDFADQIHALGVSCPSGVFLTHAHYGHYAGLLQLGPEVLAAREVPVYTTRGMRTFLSANAPWSGLAGGGNIVLTTNAAPVELGGVRVTAFPVPHRDEYSDTVGYAIEGPRRKVIFIPDIDGWDQWATDVRDVVAGADLAFLDATFFSLDELPHRDIARINHPLVTHTMERLAGLEDRVRFIHLNHSNPVLSDPSLVEAHGFRVARQGDRIPL